MSKFFISYRRAHRRHVSGRIYDRLVQRSLRYFTNRYRNAMLACIFGLGNGFRLPGLQKFFSVKLQIDVYKL